MVCDFDIALSKLDSMNATSDVSMVFEVDISYSEILHDKHSDLLFLSCGGTPPGPKVHKLMATLEQKKTVHSASRKYRQTIFYGLTGG